MKIVIPGGSGQVGCMLARYFHAKRHNVVVLSRNPAPAPWSVVAWDGVHDSGAWAGELDDSDVCINLAGRSVNCRYDKKNRSEIYNSRIDSTRLLNKVIASLRRPPRVWINASTATIYRHALDRPMDEAHGELGGNEPGAPDTWNFSISVAKGWEQAFFASEIPGTRKVAVRSAIIMSPDRGGAFDLLLGLVRHGLGGTQGLGNQYVSWIHELDFIHAIEFLICREELSGVVNLAAPHPLPNRDFLRALREAWRAQRAAMRVPRHEKEPVVLGGARSTRRPFCAVSSIAPRARLRATNEGEESAVLSVARSIPGPFCAVSPITQRAPLRATNEGEESAVLSVARSIPGPFGAFSLNTRAALPLSRWMIELGAFLLRTESELILKSRRVIPGRLAAAGFDFAYPEWPPAALDLITRWRSTGKNK